MRHTGLAGIFREIFVDDGIPQRVDRVGKQIDRTPQWRQHLYGAESRAFQRTDVAFEKKCMLATIQMMQRMPIKESLPDRLAC